MTNENNELKNKNQTLAAQIKVITFERDGLKTKVEDLKTEVDELVKDSKQNF